MFDKAVKSNSFILSLAPSVQKLASLTFAQILLSHERKLLYRLKIKSSVQFLRSKMYEAINLVHIIPNQKHEKSSYLKCFNCTRQ